MNSDFEEGLVSDVLDKIYKKLKAKVEEELKANPYAIVRLRWLKKELRGKRGLQYLIRRLSREYEVKKMGSWYVVRKRSR